jgi:hypothetical protein
MSPTVAGHGVGVARVGNEGMIWDGWDGRSRVTYGNFVVPGGES